MFSLTIAYADKEEHHVSPDTQLISVDFHDADMTSVVKTFSKILKRNIVLVDGVEKKVTVRFHKVPAMQAFRTILNVKGLYMKRDHDIVYVQAIEER